MFDIYKEQKRLHHENLMIAFVAHQITYGLDFSGCINALLYLYDLTCVNYCLVMELGHGAEMDAKVK